MLLILETGITHGSLTIPSLVSPPQVGTHRILHSHKNVPGVLGHINQTLSEYNLNILGQYLKANEQIGYAVLYVYRNVTLDLMRRLQDGKQAIKVRLLY
jgi:D-3-phosphoglycerate dehydrogenase